MDSSFLLTTVAAAVGIFTLYRKLRFHQKDNKEKSSTSSSPSSSSFPPSSVPPSLCRRIWTHQVFPSFRGEDVRREFLSHIEMEFQRKGITPFIDNEIKRGDSIGPEIIRAIRGSKIAIILLSRNYVSSSWCLDELVEIMKCREEFGQTVMTVFYKVDPFHVKKLTGDFGEVFRKTCAGKTKEDVERWRQAIAKVATIAGYHSSNWDNEAAMINKIASDISYTLNNSTLTSDFDGLVGMKTHLEKMEPLLCLNPNEVKMIGIWGPCGIGKTTIARVVYNQLSNSFQLSVFMENINAKHTRPCSDDYGEKLYLQQHFMSQITKQKDIEIPHLRVIQDRLKDKKVLVVLDGVDQSVQLDAMAKETWWFGPGSRIIITTQDQRLLKAHGINNIYNVGFPTAGEALQIFCTYAFGQKLPKDGFEELAREVTRVAGELPLGLRVLGSYFRRMSKEEWKNALPKLRTSINTEIESILKFSYEALNGEDKDLFLHITCFFNHGEIAKVENHLAKKFLDVSQGLRVLAEKSLISTEGGWIDIHNLLVQLGKEIVLKQPICEPAHRMFLVDRREICEVLTDDAAGSKNVVGIDFNFFGMKEKINISERAFEGMSNLQFIRFHGDCSNTLDLPYGLRYLSRKLRLLHWIHFPMKCLPSIVNFEFLVELNLCHSKLEKLWEGIKSLCNLRWMDLSSSENLKEVPDLSTATNLEKLNLRNCSSLINLPSSIGNATNLKKLYLSGCSSMVELPSSIGDAINLQTLDLSGLSCLLEFPSSLGNATNLESLDLSHCSSLVELPYSIRNLQKLQRLRLKGCSKLEVLPTNINLESTDELDLTNCSMLKIFPEISTSIKVLKLKGTAIEKVPNSIRSWSRLDDLHMSYCESLKEFTHALDSITELYLCDTEIQEVPSWVKSISRLDILVLKGCKNLISLPKIPDSLVFLDAEDCESLERLDCSFLNGDICLNFPKCLKLNKEARELIIKTSSRRTILPGIEVPEYFTHRATGGSLTIQFNESPLPSSMRFKVCILLVKKGVSEAVLDEKWVYRINATSVSYKKIKHSLFPLLTEHLYIFEVEEEVTSNEIFFEFKLDREDWKIGECGLLQLLEVSQ